MSQAPLTLRRWKGSLYGIVNLPDGLLEVYREPLPDASAVYGWRYRSVVSLTRADVVAPLAFWSARISVTDLLP